MQLCVIGPAIPKVLFSGNNSPGRDLIGSQSYGKVAEPEVTFSGNNTPKRDLIGSSSFAEGHIAASLESTNKSTFKPVAIVASQNTDGKVDQSGIWDILLRGILGSGGVAGLVMIIIAVATSKEKLVACFSCKRSEPETSQQMTTINPDEQCNQ